MHFVYFLVCLETGRNYVGQTDHLIRRYHSHREGSTKTTREKLIRPVMIHWEAFANRAEAMRKERYYKSGSGHRLKHSIIADAFRRLYSQHTNHLLPRCHSSVG